jgi:chorismate synthase
MAASLASAAPQGDRRGGGSGVMRRSADGHPVSTLVGNAPTHPSKPEEIRAAPTPSVSGVTYQVVHVNSEYHDQTSDHDPQVVDVQP